MAFSGSLNFISASSTGSANIKVDFVGLNTLIVDPIYPSLNWTGLSSPNTPSTEHYNSLIEPIGGDQPNQVNSLLLHRNGPYGHPMWKQWRGYNNPVARYHRLNNTMSIDAIYPDPFKYKLHKHNYPNWSAIHGKSLGYAPGESNVNRDIPYLSFREHDEETRLANTYMGDIGEFLDDKAADFVTAPHVILTYLGVPRLQQYYEPVLTTKHKPLIYETKVPGDGNEIKVRVSLMNQMMDFSSHELNRTLKLASGDPVISSLQNEKYKMSNEKYYNIFHMANKYDVTLFMYSERIYPREINSYRPFKLKRPNYEEVSGTGSNGYDRALHHLFWKDAQGGATSTATTSSTPSDGTTRLRTAGAALNSIEINQNMIFSYPSTITFITSSALLRSGTTTPPANWTSSLDNNIDGLLVHILSNGVVANRYYHTHNSGVIDQKDAYQPYPLALLSSWPLDARDDIYDKPNYLTSSIGGKGLQIGLTPHKGGNYNIFDMDGSLLSYTLYDLVRTATADFGSSQSAISSSSVTGALKNLHTGSAGELVYSTKPTIFYYDDRVESVREVSGGYSIPSASLQYHRHTFPYNTPFYVANRVRGRNPFYNSYDDFADKLKYLGRDYSIVPEYRYSDHTNYYSSIYHILGNPDQTLFKKVPPPAVDDTGANVQGVHFGAKIVRSQAFKGEITSTEMAEIYKADFLALDGADITSSAETQNYSLSSNKYKYNDISGAVLVDPADSPIYTYLSDKTSVNFDSKYAITDSTINFSHLLEIPDSFEDGDWSIPRAVEFKCSAIKKLLPYNGFYPVTRTVQIGNTFKKEMTAAAGYSGSMITIPAGQTSQSGAFLQALIEPFMAPGILYNSIKSGISVDYPIYTSNINYYVPREFVSGSEYEVIGHSDGLRLPALSSSYHGGLYMMGSSRCIPSILTSFPDDRLPFSALYNKTSLYNKLVPDSSSLHLVSDFVDLTRFEKIGSTGSMSGTLYRGAPSVKMPNDKGFLDLNSGSYFSMINNFLSETMEFFLSDITEFGTKLPIVTTRAIDSGNNAVSPITVEAKDYLMEVSLRMGAEQIMCEGPRNAGIGSVHTSSLFGKSGTNQGYFLHNSSMRGYIYGPPTEIVPHDVPGGTSPANETWYPAQETAMKDAVINHLDYSSYFAANLQDPAYHAHTPPYFYGKSSVIYKFSSVDQGTAIIGLTDLVSKMENAGVTGSYYISNYDPPKIGTANGKPVRRKDTLSLIAPAANSVSTGSKARMKLDASLGGISGLMGIYSKPVSISNFEVSNGAMHGTPHHVWAIAPEWICPVLDFSSSAAAIRNKNETISVITNSYHDETTGRGMWGGYGTNPYGSTMDALVDAGHATSTARKGIYLQINDFSLNTISTTTSGGSVDKHDPDAYYDLLGIDNSTATASLASLLDIQDAGSITKFEIGKFADSKDVYESVVLIPYVDKPINVPIIDDLVYASQHIHGTLYHDERTYYATREIIPGKYFLPINEEVFVNTLHFHLLEATKQTHINDLWGGGGYYDPEKSDYVESWTEVRNLIASTDVGQMISRLSSFNTTHGGFQLPPEFDFMHNASVPPFQIIVIPFKQELQKQELIDIYQGVMPDSSLSAMYETNSIVINPTLVPPIDQLLPGNALSASHFVPEFSSLSNSNAAMKLGPQHAASLTGFLSPLSFLDPPQGIQNDPSAGSRPYKTSAEFYRNLRFMVFKVKQRAKKDYSNYRKRQVMKAVEQRITNAIIPGSKYYKGISDGEYKKLSENRTVGDIFGANWPYDYFSLIQSLKIDITLSDK